MAADYRPVRFARDDDHRRRRPKRPEQPLYEIKARLFKALDHTARIRTPVSEMLSTIDVEPTVLSQHLAVPVIVRSPGKQCPIRRAVVAWCGDPTP
jgi:hypothetical protein